MMKISEHDVASIIDWLAGNFKEGSADDLKARRALAEVLRYGPLDPGLRFILADLIDPEMRDDLSLWLVFKRPPGRTKSVDYRNVAAVIWERIQAGDPKEAAYQHAVDTQNVKLTVAKKAYKEWQGHFRTHGSKLKGLTRIKAR
jgi:hypothetical protein